MAIGVRILSDNLSGLTTNVTYLPESVMYLLMQQLILL